MFGNFAKVSGDYRGRLNDMFSDDIVWHVPGDLAASS